MILTCVSCDSHRSFSPVQSPGQEQSSPRRDKCGQGSLLQRSLRIELNSKTWGLVPTRLWQEIVELFHIRGEIGTIPVISMEGPGVSNVCSLAETFKV